MKVPARILAAIASPLKLVDFRSKRIESWLQLPLTDEDAKLVRQACRASSRYRFGHYYHWYLQKLLVANSIRGLDREDALRLIDAADHTVYMEAARILESDSGVLVAIPHHGHYVLSMAALAIRLAASREVLVFYGQPATHKGNEVFDHLHRVLFGAPGSAIKVVHDNRQGLAQAMRSLKSGGVVFIMPDAFQDETATMMVPFCGKLMNVMLGTAILARKTRSWILPTIATPHGFGLGFRTRFGRHIDHPAANTPSASAETVRVMDYAVTRAVFDQFEQVMSGQLLYWQHMRQHLAGNAAARMPDGDALPELVAALEADPVLKPPGYILQL